jgi:hypothetical protein
VAWQTSHSPCPRKQAISGLNLPPREVLGSPCERRSLEYRSTGADQRGHYLLDLRKVPATGAVAERFASADSIMTGMRPTPVDPMVAFDAVIYLDQVSPWRTVIEST